MLLEKILLGITLAAPIGPVSIEMINRGIKKGFWASFVVGCKRLDNSLTRLYKDDVVNEERDEIKYE